MNLDKKSLNEFETNFLILISLIVGQLLLSFVSIYYKQSFPIESLTVIVIQLIAILLSYFSGLLTAMAFSLVYIIGYIFYILNSSLAMDPVFYILLFLLPLSTIIAGNMNRARKNIDYDLEKLDLLENMEVRLDPNTNLANQSSFKDVLSKNINLAHRHPSYFFSVSMFRLDSIRELKSLLGMKEFNRLLKHLARVINYSLRNEDYKFIVSQDRFVILNPLTLSKDIEPAIMRILEDISRLEIRDFSGNMIDLNIRVGSLDFSHDRSYLFDDLDKLLLELDQSSDLEIYEEYIQKE